MKEMPKKKQKAKEENVQNKLLEHEEVNIEDLHYQMVQTQQSVRKMQK